MDKETKEDKLMAKIQGIIISWEFASITSRKAITKIKTFLRGKEKEQK